MLGTHLQLLFNPNSEIMRILFFLLLIPALLVAQESRLIKGKITDGNLGLPDVAISIEGQSGGTYTNSEGRYEVEARAGDLLTFSYTGMLTRKIRVEDVTRYVNLALVPDYTELEEVTVQKRLKTQEELSREYALNTGVIRTAFGFMDANNTQGRVRVIDGTKLNTIYLCISDYLKNRFSGVYVVGQCPTGNVYIRGVGTLGSPVPVIFDVDGQIFTQTPNWLDINQINRLAIISSYSMGTRYGSQGAGGVIVINTVNSQYVANGLASGTPKVQPKALTPAELLANSPSYLQELKSAESGQQARTIYSHYADQYSASPYFVLDAYDHFYNTLGDNDFADEILANYKDIFSGNAVLLKALAYHYQQQERYDEARELFKEIFMLRPQYSQSYLDMANAYRDAGELSKSASLFGRYQYLLQEGFLVGSDDFWLIQQHDSDNLFAMSGKALGADLGEVSTDPYLEGATRLVFEWNETGAEFELQFVNPNNQFYTWEHTYAKNGTRMDDEQMAGYAMEEYIIDPATPGSWNVNVTYLGNPALTPTYLKLTVYRNYGKSNQSKKVYTYKLFLQDSNQRLLTINAGGQVTVQ